MTKTKKKKPKSYYAYYIPAHQGVTTDFMEWHTMASVYKEGRFYNFAREDDAYLWLYSDGIPFSPSSKEKKGR